MTEATRTGPAPSFDVFLSYRSSDKDLVRQLAVRLQDDAGVRPFFDEWDLVLGLPWQEQLEKALGSSDSCAVCIGPSGLSPWENEETRVVLADRIERSRMRVIPVLLPGATEKTIETLPPLLRRHLWVDFRAGLDDQAALVRLVAGNVYVGKGRVSKGLQRHGGKLLDPHLGWELAERVRRALHLAEFDAWITRGLFEIFIVGQK